MAWFAQVSRTGQPAQWALALSVCPLSEVVLSNDRPRAINLARNRRPRRVRMVCYVPPHGVMRIVDQPFQ